VKPCLKSVVREIRTLRSVGIGGRQLPPMTRWMASNGCLYPEVATHLDILVQSRRNKGAALRFFRKLFKGQASMPWKVITDKLRSYQAALCEIAPSQIHITDQYENNRAEVSHQPTRQQERQMRRFKSPGQAQRFLSFHGLVNNFFRRQRHLLSAANYRTLRDQAFGTWEQATCAC
jgi:putative transposase